MSRARRSISGLGIGAYGLLAPSDRYQGMRDVIVDLRAVRRSLKSDRISGARGPSASVRLLTQRSVRIAGVILLSALAIAGVTGWRLLRRAQSERDRQAAIAEVEHLVDQGRFVEVWRAAQPALERWPGDPYLEQMLHSTTDSVTITTDPPGAAVAFKAYDDISGAWIPLGTTPLKGVRAPLGILRWQITRKGFDTLEARLQVGAPAAAMGLPDRDAKPIRLRPTNSDMSGMVVVPGGPESGIQLSDYWLDQTEVTNRYLNSRGDIAKDKIAYYGFSMGAEEAVPAVALEKRLKAVMFLTGGLAGDTFPPEVNPVNFLPRITAPVLMLGGRYDFVFPPETSQKPLFALLGTPAEHKKFVLFENAGHVPPRIDVIRECLSWLERYLGPVERRVQ
jgi:hypothetical protein